jgi:hypothetical protein
MELLALAAERGCLQARSNLRCASMARTAEEPDHAGRPSWTFLTNHGHVLVCIATDPGVRGRDVAARVGITERAAQAIIADLVREGYVTRTRIGRRNHYEINPDRPLRHPVEQPHNIGELLQLVAGLEARRRRRASAS